MENLWGFEIITELTSLHLLIDRKAHEIRLRTSKKEAGRSRISSQQVWSSMNTYISSVNFPSDVIVKKVNIPTERNFSTVLKKNKGWKREYTDVKES